MASSSTMEAWQYSSVTGGLDKALQLNKEAAQPPQQIGPKDIKIKVIAASLNPVDYKIPEFRVLSVLAHGRSTTPSPCLDGTGRVVQVGSEVTGIKAGQLVVCRHNPPVTIGTLSQYTVLPRSACAVIPDGVDPVEASGLGTAGLTAYQSVVPNVTGKTGARVFINGGSGGVGAFCIQIAKISGCFVVTSCSTPNVDLCKSLGADEVIDYKTENVVQRLKELGSKDKFDLIVDNVGIPANLYRSAIPIINPTGKFVIVGVVGLSNVAAIGTNILLPSFLGGGKASFQVMMTKNNPDELAQLATWVKEGKMKILIDEKFPWSEAPQAFTKLKSGRAKGKIIVKVSEP